MPEVSTGSEGDGVERQDGGRSQAREMELSVLWCPALSGALGWPNPPDSATHFPTSLVSISSMAWKVT